MIPKPDIAKWEAEKPLKNHQDLVKFICKKEINIEVFYF